jgi:hypothetical protein
VSFVVLKKVKLQLHPTRVVLSKASKLANNCAITVSAHQNSNIFLYLHQLELYHVHYDTDGFEYKVVLTRIELTPNKSGKFSVEKYTLYLFESNAKPPILWMFGAKFSRQYRPTTLYRDQCHAMTFQEAFRHFKHFFKGKTGVEWDMRLEKEQYNIAQTVAGTKQLFRYTPPVLGRKVGLLPWGYVRPELRKVDMEKASASETESESAEVFYDDDSDLDSADGDAEEDNDDGSKSQRSGSGSGSEENSNLEIKSANIGGGGSASHECMESKSTGNGRGSLSETEGEESFIDEGLCFKEHLVQ